MPIQQSVGKGRVNRPDDVRHVQSLLNDWRHQNQLPPIAVDGLVGPQTISAILEFQQRVTHIVDGRVDPSGPAITQLEGQHDSQQIAELTADVLGILNYFDRLRLMTGSLLPIKLQLNANVVRAEVANLQRLHGSTAAPLAPRLPRGSQLAVVQAAPAVALTAAQLALLAALLALMAFGLYALLDPKGARALKHKIVEWASTAVVEVTLQIAAITSQVNLCRQKIGEKATKNAACRDALAEFEAKVTATQAKAAELHQAVRQAIDSPFGVSPADLNRIRQLMQELNVLNAATNAAGNQAMLKCGCLGPVLVPPVA